MIGGSSHTIEVTVSDNGTPALSTSASIPFSIAADQVTQPVDDVNEQPSESSGGTIYNLLWIILLSCYCAYVRQYKKP